MNDFSTYQNKLFSILGDSIGTLEGYNPPDYEVFYRGETCYDAEIFLPSDTWWGQVIDALGGELLVNNSLSGSLVCKHPMCEIPSYGASDERTAMLGKNGRLPDIVMVWLGTNDRGYAMKPAADPGEEYDLSIFSSAYRIMLEKIQRNYPNALILCFTLGVSRCAAQPSFCFSRCYGGRDITEYCDVIRDCAKKRNCRLIDLYSETSAEPYDTMDGLHPNAEGMKTIARAVLRQLSQADRKE